MPSRGWDATSHEALLLAFIDEIKPNKAMITLVTERMKEMGYTYSYDAIKCFHPFISCHDTLRVQLLTFFSR